MNIRQAQGLKGGDILHFTGDNPCGTNKKIFKVRVTGKVKTWKTQPEWIRVPIKHGLYDSGYLTHENLDKFHLEADCPLQGKGYFDFSKLDYREEEFPDELFESNPEDEPRLFASSALQDED